MKLPGTPTPMEIWIASDGIEIAGDHWGNPSGPLVILQHGGGQTRHAWKNTGETLGNAGYHAIAFDARGHGDSGWAEPGHYGADFMVEDLSSVIKAMDGKTPILVGASMGGGTSLIAIGEKKIPAKALVLVDMAPSIEQEGQQQIQDFMDQCPNGFDSLDQVAEAIANYQPHRPRKRNLDGLAKNVRIGKDGRFRWHWDPEWRRGRGSMDTYRARLRDSAFHINVPALLVRGALSNVLTEAGAQEFLKQCPQAEYVNVKSAAHMVAGDRNDVFADAVINFLGRVAPV